MPYLCQGISHFISDKYILNNLSGLADWFDGCRILIVALKRANLSTWINFNKIQNNIFLFKINFVQMNFLQIWSKLFIWNKLLSKAEFVFLSFTKSLGNFHTNWMKVIENTWISLSQNHRTQEKDFNSLKPWKEFSKAISKRLKFLFWMYCIHSGEQTINCWTFLKWSNSQCGFHTLDCSQFILCDYVYHFWFKFTNCKPWYQWCLIHFYRNLSCIDHQRISTAAMEIDCSDRDKRLWVNFYVRKFVTLGKSCVTLLKFDKFIENHTEIGSAYIT